MRDEMEPSARIRSRRRSRRPPRRHPASSSRTTNAPGTPNWGTHEQTLPIIEAASKQQAVSPRRLSLHRRLDQPPRRPGHRRVPHHDHLVDAASRDGRPRPRPTSPPELGRRHRTRRRGGSIRPARSTSRWTRRTCERVLRFPLTMIGSDGLPHDAAPASAPLGHVPARARPLRRDSGSSRSRPRSTR